MSQLSWRVIGRAFNRMSLVQRHYDLERLFWLKSARHVGLRVDQCRRCPERKGWTKEVRRRHNPWRIFHRLTRAGDT